jgi:hypothetical protein
MNQRVGILTLPLDPNYGGMLQAVALYAFLEGSDKHVIFLNKYEPRGIQRRLKNRLMKTVPFEFIRRTANTAFGRKLRNQAPNEYDMARHRQFLEKYLPRRTRILYKKKDLRNAVQSSAIDTVIVGSDQIWNYGLKWRDGIDTYFCGFLEGDNVRRVSYAASFGHDCWGFHDLTDRARTELAKFAAVSAREASGVRICAETLGRSDCVHVLDPTLLMRPDFYETMTAGVAAPDHAVLLEYVLDADADKEALTGEALAALGRPHAPRRLSATDGVDAIDAPGWVAAFRDAAFVVTDSFHGTVFSIMFRKNFIAIVNPERGGDRFFSLLGQLGLRDRLIHRGEIDKVRALAQKPIDFEPAHRALESLREHSARFLLAALR